MTLQVDVPPGVVAATFFIIFDVLILALLDVVLAHIVCAIYYRNIHHGRPINVQSADIPGVTTYLLGKLFSVTNILALGLKTAFIAIVFAVNLDIDGEVVYRAFPESRLATFDFDPSPAAWDGSPSRAVIRDRGFMQSCYNHSATTEDFLIFRIAYNLTGGATPEAETELPHGSIPINRTSIECLNDGVKEPQVLINVTGCSPFLTTLCANGTTAEIRPDVVPSDEVATATLPRDERYPEDFNFNIEVYNGSGMVTEFPDYDNSVMYCARFCPGPQARECCTFENPDNCNPPVQPCVMVATIDGDTLIERWEIVGMDGPRLVLRRDFPGPKFEGEWDISLPVVALSLLDLDMMMDWRSFATTVATDAAVYRRADLRYERLEKRTVTKLPTYAVVLGGVALMFAVFSRIVVSFTLGKDDRPRFNSIDGLSSIVREENSPSGRSYESGDTAVVGLSHRGVQGVHFGPLQYRQDSVARGNSKIS